jgi:Sulfotransferase family
VISARHRCVFVHVPKTAGMSVEHVFVQLSGLTWETRAPLLLHGNDDPRLGPPRLAHLTAGEYVSCGHLSAEEFASYFKFAFVRNPWDRMVSEYKYRGFPVKIDFKTYLFRRLPAPGWTDTYRHIIPQLDFVADESGRLLVDFVGRFENLQADFDQVCVRLGLAPTPLPRVNRSLEDDQPLSFRELRKRLRRAIHTREREHTFSHYTEYYDAESREFVGDMFRKDIEAFSYSFEDGAPSRGRAIS